MRLVTRLLLPLLLSLVFVAIVQAQTPVWMSRHDAQGASIDEGRILLTGPDGGAIIVGSSVASGAGWNATTGWDVVVAAYDSSGAPRWNARYDGLDHNDERALCAVAGNDHVIVGARGWSSQIGWRGILLAYNAAGTQVWMRNVPAVTSGGASAVRSVGMDAAGNIFAAVHTETLAKSYSGLVSYSRDGDLRWRVTVDTAGSVRPSDLVVLADGSIMLGITRSGAPGRAGVVLITPAGTLQWERLIPGAAEAECGPLVLAAPDAVFLAGTVAGGGGGDALLARISANGNIDWQTTYAGQGGRDDRPASLSADAGGNLIAALRSENTDGSVGIALVKYARSGAFLWAGRYDSAATGADTDAPLFAGAAVGHFVPARGAVVEWSAARDDYSEAPWIRYRIYVSEESGMQDFGGQAAEVLGMTHVEIPGLPIGRDYYMVVRAFDVAGNGDANTREVRITVPGPQKTTLDLRRDTVFAGGTHCYDAVHIAAGATLRFTGPATLCARDSMRIDGTVSADCHALTVRCDGELHVRGRIENRCVTGDSTRAGDLTVLAFGAIALDSVSNRSGIYSSGRVLVTDDTTFTDWQLAIPPFARSKTPVPPVGMLDAAQVLVGMTGAAPAEVTFFAEGADPDGGPVRFDIDFGDGDSRSAIAPLDGIHASIEKSYAAPGKYVATLVIHDDEGDTARASITVHVADSTGDAPAGIGLAARAGTFAAGVGDTVQFSMTAQQLGSDTLVATDWDFGGGAAASTSEAARAFNATGRHRVSATVLDDSNRISSSVLWLWVYTPDTTRPFFAPGRHSLALAPPPPVIVAVPIIGDKGDRVVFPGRDIIFRPGAGIIGVNGDAGAEGRSGSSGTGFTMWAGGKITIAGGIYGAGNGGDGGAASRNGSGKSGGAGGNMNFSAHEIDITGGTFFGSDGGDGGGDVKVGGPGQSVSASGGNGGKPGSISFRAAKRIRILAPVTIVLGDGGAGGTADATGGAGIDRCPRGQDGGSGTARGGAGGAARKAGVAFGRVEGAGLLRITGATGGAGGAALADGGRGGDAIGCKTTANGGKGGNATATGGKGGESGYSGIGVPLGALGTGGAGGNATATPGRGGHADAVGDPQQGADGCPGQDGGDATATGGQGGTASAKEGKGGKSNRVSGTDGWSNENGSNGGDATAIGGNGGNGVACGCAGGNGGKANATAGRHGNTAKRATVSVDGNDGTATAEGGKGGKGGSCCPTPSKGGDGGKGGAATATVLPNGTTDGGGGAGGNGGDGCPFGAGGAGGIGTGVPNDIPDGPSGTPGILCCPVPVPVKFKTPCTGTAVPITPGAVQTWEIWNPPQTTQLANLNMHFMTQQEAGGPVNYQCFAQNTDIGIESGGMIINMASIVDLNSPSKQWTCTSFTFCAMAITPGECTVTGLRNGQEIASKTQQLSGIGTVTVDAPQGELFDEIRVLVYTPVRFNWWWQTAKCTGP